ncbi:MAG: four-carbon acid sugar kinase family protein [Clostridiales bacterium]|nr:four-carbon acid sugar kinase family protein [Clostridiales bacterium]
MISLLVIADDFTGALDTGVQFAERGIRTRVMIADSDENDGAGLSLECAEDIQVLVVDAETRHMTAEAAYRKVYAVAAQAVEAGISFLYKKTDSALRGNIGSELSALLDASKEAFLPFVPAFPGMKRITKDGIHYIDGVPVSRSVFGRDPFEPVRKDSVREIIALQSSRQVKEIRDLSGIPWGEKGIWVFDSSSDEETGRIAERLKEKRACRILAGCAGFASMLPEILGLQGTACQEEELESKLLVVCGSVNPITRRQLEHGEDRGYFRMHLTMRERLDPGYWFTEDGQGRLEQLKRAYGEHVCCMVDSNDKNGQQDILEYADREGLSLDEVRRSITGTLGLILRMLLDEGVRAVLLVTGGDTLLGFMKEIGLEELEPIREILPGCVLTRFRYGDRDYHMITKSGGFGEETLLEDMIEALKKGR